MVAATGLEIITVMTVEEKSLAELESSNGNNGSDIKCAGTDPGTS